MVALVVARLYYRYLTSPLRHAPGPPRRSFWCGYFWTILREPYLDPHKKWWKDQIATLQKSPPFLAYSTLLGRYTLLLLDPQLVKLVLTEPAAPDPVRFRKNYYMLQEIAGHGLVTLEGTAWSRHRRCLQPAFHVGFLKQHVNQSAMRHTERLIDAWQTKIQTNLAAHSNDASSHGSCDVHVAAHMSAVTLDIIGDVAFAHNFGASDAVTRWSTTDPEAPLDETTVDPLIQALHASFRITPLGMMLSIWNLSWLEKYLNRSVARTRTLLHAAVDRVIAAARAATPAQHDASLLQLLLRASTTTTPLSQRELRDEVKTFIIAGHETTSTWCYWALYALAKHADVQDKVHQEIVKHAGNEMISSEQVDQMDYVLAFLNEVLRLYSPVGALIRFTTRTEQWQGQTVPARTRLVIPIHLLHRHPDHWSSANYPVHDFCPERWLEPDAPRHRASFIPFSSGGRNCIGQRFAEMEAKVILVNLVRAFRLQLAPCMQSQELHFTAFLTMKAKEPIVIRVRRRE